MQDSLRRNFTADEARPSLMANRSLQEPAPPLELSVQGRGCRLFEDEALASYVSKQALMPWQGREDTTMDRYDVRHMLDSLAVLRKRRELPSVADVDDAELQRERFLDLQNDGPQDGSKAEKDKEAMDTHLGGAAIPFNYSNSNQAVASEPGGLLQPENGKKESEQGTFRPPFRYPPELAAHLPPSEKLHKIMAHTANFIVTHGGQAEIVLRVKQAKNPNFGFLTPGHQLDPYFRFLVEHPDYMVTHKEASPPARDAAASGEPPPAQTAMSLLGTYGEEEEDEEEKEKRKLLQTGSDAPASASLPAEEAANEPETAPAAESLPRPEAETDAAPKAEDQPAEQSLPVAQPEAVPMPEVPPPAEAEIRVAPEPTAQTPPAAAPAAAGPQEKILPAAVGAPPAEAEPASAQSVTGVATADGVSGPPVLPPLRIVEPPQQMQLIIEKMVEFIARNGASFEGVVRERDRAQRRFLFLLPENEFYGYYRMRLQGALQSAGLPASMQEKDAEEDVAKPSKGIFIRSATLTGAFARAKTTPPAAPAEQQQQQQQKEEGQTDVPAKEEVPTPKAEVSAQSEQATEQQQAKLGDTVAADDSGSAAVPPAVPAQPQEGATMEAPPLEAKEEAGPKEEPAAEAAAAAVAPLEGQDGQEGVRSLDEELERVERRRRRKQRKEEEALRLRVQLERDAQKGRHRSAEEEAFDGGKGEPLDGEGGRGLPTNNVADDDLEEGEAGYHMQRLAGDLARDPGLRAGEAEREERRRKRKREKELRRREHDRRLAPPDEDFGGEREEEARRHRRPHRRRDQDSEDGGGGAPPREYPAAVEGKEGDWQAAAPGTTAEEEARRQRRRERKRQKRGLPSRYEEGGAAFSSEEEEGGYKPRRRYGGRSVEGLGQQDEYAGEPYPEQGERDDEFLDRRGLLRRRRSWAGYDDYEAEEGFRRRDFRGGFPEYEPSGEDYRVQGGEDYRMRGSRGVYDEYGAAEDYRLEEEERERRRRKEERRRRRAEERRRQEEYEEVEAGEFRGEEEESARVVVPPEIRARVQAIYRM